MIPLKIIIQKNLKKYLPVVRLRLGKLPRDPYRVRDLVPNALLADGIRTSSEHLRTLSSGIVTSEQMDDDSLRSFVKVALVADEYTVSLRDDAVVLSRSSWDELVVVVVAVLAAPAGSQLSVRRTDAYRCRRVLRSSRKNETIMKNVMIIPAGRHRD